LTFDVIGFHYRSQIGVVGLGQTHVHRYMTRLLDRVRRGEVDPTFVITHRMRLEDAPTGYEIFKNKEDGCLKVVMSPW
jgi:threonine dehydrogenase-like Zn-dependent dehydrogenase